MSTKTWVRLVPLVALVLSFAFVQRSVPVTYASTGPASGANLTNLFQLDGNALSCSSGSLGGGAKQDWDIAIRSAITQALGSYNPPLGCTFTGTPPSPTQQSFVHDGFSGTGGTDTTIFQGGTSKDTCEISSAATDNPCSGNWAWSPTAGLQDKNDLTNVYAASYNVTNGTFTDQVLTFGSDRYAQNGSAQQSFWFTKNKVGLVNTPGSNTCTTSSGCPFSGTHSFGDLLVQVNFSQGGVIGNVSVFQWIGNGGSAPTGCSVVSNSLCQLYPAAGQSATPDCSTTTTTTTGVCAIVNNSTNNPSTGSITSPWPYQAKGSSTANSIPASGFLEGAIDLTYLFGKFGEVNPCVSQYIAETRSSTSTDSTTSDFALGNFGSCSGNITINPPNPVNEVNHAETFTVQVNQNINGAMSGVANTPVTATITSDTTGGATFAQVNGSYGTCGTPANPQTSPPTATGTTNSTGSCTVNIVSPHAGQVTVSASSTIPNVGAVSTDGTGTNSNPAVKRFVDARITLTPLNATNDVATHPVHTIYARVQQDDGLPAGATGGDSCTGFCDAPTGAKVSWGALANNTAGAVFTSSDGTANNGIGGGTAVQCTTSSQTVNSVTGNFCPEYIKSAAAGSVNVPASVSLSYPDGLGGTLTVNRATDDTLSGDSTHANKVFVDARITLTPLTATNSIGQPHQVTAEVFQDDGQPANTNGGDACTGFCAAPAGTVVSLTLTNSNSTASFCTDSTCTAFVTTGTPTGSATTCALTVTNGHSTCSIYINSMAAGTVTIHATTTFNVGVNNPGGAVSVTRATGDNLSGDSSDATKIYVAGTLSLTKTVDVGTVSGESGGPAGYPKVCFTLSYDTLQTGDVHISPIASDTSSDANTVYTYDSATDTEKECHQYSSADTNATTGVTSFTFTWHPLSKSHYVATESYVTAPWVGIAAQHVFVDPTGTDSQKNVAIGPFNDPLPTGSLKVEKTINGLDAPLTGDQFTFKYQYCAGDHTCGSPAAATTTSQGILVPGCNVADGTAQSTSCSPRNNPITVSGLKEGYYLVTETNVPAAYSIDSSTNPRIIEVFAANDQAGGTIPVATINNIKLFRIIVVTCDMNNNLVPSNVSITAPAAATAGPLQSVAHNGYTPSGASAPLSDATLCGIPGATFPGLQPGTYTLSVGPLG